MTPPREQWPPPGAPSGGYPRPGPERPARHARPARPQSGAGPQRATGPQPVTRATGPQPVTRATGPQPAARPTGPWPATRATGPQPAARATGPQPAVSAQVNGHSPARPAPVNGQAARRYPAANGRGVPLYPLTNGQAILGYPPATPGYPPYPPATASLMPGYQSHPAPSYLAPSYPAPSYPPVNGSTLLGSPPVNGTPSAGYRHAPEDSGPIGKRILGWLPFGQRLVLLPRAPSFIYQDQGQELREHRDVAGGWLRPAVFGAMDGLVTNSSLIAGIGGGGGGGGMIVLTGIAGLIAGAFSMATGEYISVTSQNELAGAEIELERLQHQRDPAGKQKRLTEVFIEKGVSPNLAEAVVRQISADTDRAVATHVREELGIDPDDMPSPRTAAVASFAAFTVGALIPLSPFLLGYPVLKVALALAGVAAIAGGAAVAKLTGRSMLAGGLRQFTAAFVATGMAFAVGHVIGGRIS